MTSYNGRYRYNLPILMYDGDFIQVDNELVVNSETNTLIDLIDSVAFGDLSYELSDLFSYAQLTSLNDTFAFADILVNIDDNQIYTNINIEKSNILEFGSISLTKTTIDANSAISVSQNPFGTIDLIATDETSYLTVDLSTNSENSSVVISSIDKGNFSNIQLELDEAKPTATDLSITIIPNV